MIQFIYICEYSRQSFAGASGGLFGGLNANANKPQTGGLFGANNNIAGLQGGLNNNMKPGTFGGLGQQQLAQPTVIFKSKKNF